MTQPAGGIDWRDLPEFAGLDLCQSYILSWHVEGGALIVDVDLLLTPEHPRYETPRPNEKICIRPAKLEFQYCDSIRIDGKRFDKSLAETVARLSPGAIAGFKRLQGGPFEISGAFGTVLIDAERPLVHLRSR